MDPLAASYLTTGMIEDLERLIRRQGRAISDIFALRAWSGFKSMAVLETKQDVVFDYTQTIDRWLDAHAGVKATQIGATTTSIIQRALIAADREGLSIPQTANLIRRMSGGRLSVVRAATIAQTEVNAIANVGNEAAAVATGEELIREWLSIGDIRTRPSLVSADGQRREVGEPYIVGGSKLTRPGDPTAPLREIIRCRCTQIFEPKDDDDE
ncbi:MAG: hypothetical protein JKX96_00605 [Acinetobacter sp.]|nr:hypothetical protein [Acinetobacter sp.]